MRAISLQVHEIDGSVAEHLVGERDLPVPRVSDGRPLHAVIVRPSEGRGKVAGGSEAKPQPTLVQRGVAGTGSKSVLGTRPATVVPSPGADRSSSSPPTASSRSLIPWSPVPYPVELGSNPMPSSETSNRRPSSPRMSRMTARDAPAYLATFCSASRQQK